MRLSDYTLKVLCEFGDTIAFDILKYKLYNNGIVFSSLGTIYSIHWKVN